MNVPDRLSVAAWLVNERGLSLIPLERHGKKPIAPWKLFQEARPTADNLTVWFGNGADRNFGIVTGAISAVVAIDCDSPEAVAWADDHLPSTAMITKTAKGQHRFFRYPGVPVRNKARIRTGNHQLAVDVRGDGGYVVGPTSVHPDGIVYQRVGPWPPIDQLPIFDPAWLETDVPESRQVRRARVRSDDKNRDTTIRRARAYLAAIPPAIEGSGGDAHTFQVVCRIVRGFDLPDAEARELLSEWNQRCVPPWSDGELHDKIAGARQYGDEPIGGRLADPPHVHDAEPPFSVTTTLASLHAPRLIRLSDVTTEPLDPVWPGRLYRGKYTLMAGDPGKGKSRLMFDVAARITTGALWPDGGRAPLGNVLFLLAEDGLADTVRPTIDAMGGDVSRVFILEGVIEGNTTRLINLARDLSTVDAAITAIDPVLLVIDPITAYLGKTDSYKDAEVRGLLAPLLATIATQRTALCTVAHLAKDQQRAALHRPGGSVAFVAAARLVFALAADPDDEDRRILAPLKSNICRPAPSLAFRLPDGCLAWEAAAASLSAEELLRPVLRHADPDEATDAEHVIRELLQDPSLWPLEAKQALAAGAAHGIHGQTLRRAAKRLEIVVKREGFGKGGRWVWCRPTTGNTEPTPTPVSVSSMSSMASMPKHASIDDNNNIDDKTLALERTTPMVASSLVRSGRLPRPDRPRKRTATPPLICRS